MNTGKKPFQNRERLFRPRVFGRMFLTPIQEKRYTPSYVSLSSAGGKQSVSPTNRPVSHDRDIRNLPPLFFWKPAFVQSRKTESCRWERTVVDVSIGFLTNAKPILFVRYFDCGVDLEVAPIMSSIARHCSRIIPRGL